MTVLHFHLPDPAATRALGARVAAVLRPGMTVHLSGDLGAGKTTLARGLLHALGFAGKVKSPTYTLVELYTTSRLDLYHFDFYRFRDPNEWHEAGFAEHFNERAVCLVEWPEKAAGLLPPPDLAITLAAGDMRHAENTLSAGNTLAAADTLADADGSRDATVASLTETGLQCLERLRADRS